ncbi:hypothetical protein [Streptomyces sp. NPDC091259]
MEVSDEGIEAAIALADTLSVRDIGEMPDEYREALELFGVVMRRG